LHRHLRRRRGVFRNGGDRTVDTVSNKKNGGCDMPGDSERVSRHARLALMAVAAMSCSARADDNESQAQGAEAATVQLDEVVVTAMRREQLARNVPLSMSTLTGDKLVQMGATKFDEYA